MLPFARSESEDFSSDDQEHMHAIDWTPEKGFRPRDIQRFYPRPGVGKCICSNFRTTKYIHHNQSSDVCVCVMFSQKDLAVTWALPSSWIPTQTTITARRQTVRASRFSFTVRSNCRKSPTTGYQWRRAMKHELSSHQISTTRLTICVACLAKCGSVCSRMNMICPTSGMSLVDSIPAPLSEIIDFRYAERIHVETVNRNVNLA